MLHPYGRIHFALALSEKELLPKLIFPDNRRVIPGDTGELINQTMVAVS